MPSNTNLPTQIDPPAVPIMDDFAMGRPSKKRRLSGTSIRSIFGGGAMLDDSDRTTAHQGTTPLVASSEIGTDSTTQAIAPFLAKYRPSSVHAPLGQIPAQSLSEGPSGQDGGGGKACYRHRSDLKCRRQADEPSMEKLQKDIESLSPEDQQAISHVWALFSAAPAKHRNLMLQGILTQCCFPQLSFLATKTRDLIKIDFMAALPTEMAIKVLCFLDTSSLTKAAQVSKKWRSLADDDVVWHKMCEQHIDRKCTKCGWGLPLLERRRLIASKKHIERRVASMAVRPVQTQCDSGAPTSVPSPSPQSIEPPPLQTRPWKEVYKDRYRVGCNWKHGRYTTKVFRGHTNGVMALQFEDNILATGSYDSTIKVWDINTGEILQTLDGHTRGVRCLQLRGNVLLSGSMDKTIKVWDWRAGTCSRTITGHDGEVLSLHFVNGIFASGSADHTVRITDFKSDGKYVLRGHTDFVNSVRIDEASRTLFSASDDNTVRLWDLDTRETIRIFAGHVECVQQVMPLPREFVFDEEPCIDSHSSDGHDTPEGTPVRELGDSQASEEVDLAGSRIAPPHYMLTSSLDNTSRLWDVRSGRTVKTYYGHIEPIWALAADNLRFVTGSQDKTVKIWDPKEGHKRTIVGHTGPVTCVALGDSTLFSGSDDGEVRMYSFA